METTAFGTLATGSFDLGGFLPGLSLQRCPPGARWASTGITSGAQPPLSVADLLRALFIEPVIPVGYFYTAA